MTNDTTVLHRANIADITYKQYLTSQKMIHDVNNTLNIISFI